MVFAPFKGEAPSDVLASQAPSSCFADTVLDSISPHIAIVDEAGKIIKVNASWLRFAQENGMPPGRGGVGESYFDACRPSNSVDFVARAASDGLKAVIEGRRPEFSIEYPCHSPDKQRWFLMNVRSLQGAKGAVVSHHDISPLKGAELALEESRDHAVYTAKRLADRELFLNSLATNLPGLVAYWDKNLRCRFANRHYVDWFGIPAERMYGITIQELMGDALYARNEKYIRGALHGENQTFERELVKANGTIGHTLARYIVDKDEHGRVKGFLALVTDVTQLKRTEIQLREANEQSSLARDCAEAANVAKSQFLATMSHELRTPLHTIIGFSEMMLDPRLDMSDIKQISEYIGDIHSSASHLLNVVNDVLDVAKIESGTLEIQPVNLPAVRVITSVWRLFTERAQKSQIVLETDVSPDTPDLWADERAVKQILFNLISNAFKFTPSGGKITLASKPYDAGVEISVSDTGFGIHYDQIDRLLQPFEQIDNQYAKSANGTGLGLSVIQGLIKLHGGKLCVQSEPGKGTIVTVRFPNRSVI